MPWNVSVIYVKNDAGGFETGHMAVAFEKAGGGDC